MNKLQFKDVTKSYGKSRGIENIDLEIKKGEVFGFIGPNGAGKSTAIKCILDFINKNSGEIIIDEKIITKNNKDIKQEIGYLPAEIHLYEDLTVRKMLAYSASFYQKDCKERTEELVKKLDLDLDKKIEELSLGNLKKVGIILALMHEPKLVIMDEATSGLDPLMQEAFYEMIEQEKQKGTTIFFSSHILSEVKRICDKVAIIKEGKIIKIENVDSLNHSSFVKVEIQAEQIEAIKDKLSNEIVEETEGKIKLIYKQDINQLIAILNQFHISKILIEEPSIEEIFMHYYQ